MTPRIRNINYVNIDCKGAGQHAIRIQGLPEMPIEAIRIENIKVESELGALLIDAASIQVKDVEIRTRGENILTFDNCRNIIIENLGETDGKVQVIGKDSRDIRLINCKINTDNIVNTDGAEPVSVLFSK
jgi:polygalacturonase